MKSIDLDGKVRPLTVKKYTLFLQSALIKIKTDNQFNHYSFTKEAKLASNFLEFMYRLRYIDKTKEGKNVIWHVLYRHDPITETDGWKLAQLSLGYNLINIQHLGKVKAKEELDELVNDLNFNSFNYHNGELTQFKSARKELQKNSDSPKVLNVSDIETRPSLEQILSCMKISKVIQNEIKSIEEFSDEELFSELKNRGYEGELNKIKTLK